jgi:Ca2+-binding RTX toxin-like protein
LNAGNFVSAKSAASMKTKDANDFFLYNRANDTLWFDDDGNGTHAAVMIADFSNDFNLAASDILVV